MLTRVRTPGLVALALAGLGILGVLVWQAVTAAGDPNPTIGHLSRGSVILDSGILVFREGLEAILVLAAITASVQGVAATARLEQAPAPRPAQDRR